MTFEFTEKTTRRIVCLSRVIACRNVRVALLCLVAFVCQRHKSRSEKCHKMLGEEKTGDYESMYVTYLQGTA